MKALIGTELLRKPPTGPVDVRDTKLTGFVLRVRPNGRHSYYATWGRGKWKLLGTTETLSPAEARDEARKVLADVWKGEDPIAKRRADKSRLTLEDYLHQHYEPWAASQHKSGRDEIDRVRTAFAELLSCRLDEISAFAVERWRAARLKAGRRPATVNRDVSALRAALSRAIKWKLLKGPHPLSEVKPLKVDCGGVVRYLTPHEEQRLRATLAARDEGRRAERERANAWRRARGYPEWPAYGTYTDHLTPIVLLALNTGLRRGELFGLRWRDVDLGRALLTVRGDGAKSGQTRHVPLNREAVEVLTAWSLVQPHPLGGDTLVFAGVEGAPLEDIKTAWLKVVRAAGIPSFRFHDLRHTFASKLVMAGVDLNTVRELLGHADLKMTLRYAHLAPEHKAAAVAKLVPAS